ncbi:MAG: hypothetical protein KJO77_01960, partial [Bacteroidia bacterium]|nr:hypothetical protein [Bacteroidia bacterium]
MKTKLLCGILFTLLTVTASFGQFSKVKVRVKWKQESYNYKVEVYTPAHDLLVTLCDDTQCYTGSQLTSFNPYGGLFNLGCVADGNNSYMKLYAINDNGWNN